MRFAFTKHVPRAAPLTISNRSSFGPNPHSVAGSKANHREQSVNSLREIKHHSRQIAPSAAHAFMIDLINKLWAYESDRCVNKPATFYDFIKGSTFGAACMAVHHSY